jgi:hypothetical protein
VAKELESLVDVLAEVGEGEEAAAKKAGVADEALLSPPRFDKRDLFGVLLEE